MDSHDRPLALDPPDLVAIDLDGTLVRTDTTISPSTIDAVRRAVEAGVRVVLATGRPPRGCRQIYAQLHLDTWQINHNGALVYDPLKNRAIHHHQIPGPLARRVIELARRTDPNIAAGVEVLDRLYIDRKVAGLSEDPSLAMKEGAVGTLASVLDAPVTRVVLVGEPQALGGVHLELDRLGRGALKAAFTHMRLLSVIDGGACKALALKRVAAHYEVPRQRVLAIGDAPNDLDMLQWAGVSIAVANAWDDVRRAAHFVVPSNDDDGVAEALRRYVLRR